MAEQLAQVEQQGGTLEMSDFGSLLQKEFKPQSDKAKESVENAVRTLAEQALQGSNLVSGDVLATIESLIAALDKKLSEQINLILHAPEFQKLEGAWRGLHHLVNNTETDEQLKIRVMNISKNDLGKTLKKFKGTAWDQSPIFKKMYEEEYGQFGGEPFGAIVADYYFDNSAPDVELLSSMAKVAAAAHAPFIAAAAPSVMLMESWQELANPRDLTKIFQTPEHAAWRSFRESEDSRYVGLTLPRFLGRLPYNPVDGMTVEGFNYVEDVDGTDHGKYLWCNAAYAFGARLTRAFEDYGWCAAIRGVEGGGLVENLPTHTFKTDEGDIALKCPTELAITDRREKELSDLGFISLVHCKNTSYAAFFGAQSEQKARKYSNEAANANALLSSQLQYIFAVSRIAHYMKAMMRDKIGSFAAASNVEDHLNSWLTQYVLLDDNATQEQKSQFPLREASVQVSEVPGLPGVYRAVSFLRPHFQLDELSVSLRLVAELPQSTKS